MFVYVNDLIFHSLLIYLSSIIIQHLIWISAIERFVFSVLACCPAGLLCGTVQLLCVKILSYFLSAGFWSFRKKVTSTFWSRNGGRKKAAATCRATQTPSRRDGLCVSTALQVSSASLLLGCCWPSWWLRWRRGGTATTAGESSPKRWPLTTRRARAQAC